MDKKRKFIKPVAEKVDFDTCDIITYSDRGTAPDDWGQYPDAEDWKGIE